MSYGEYESLEGSTCTHTRRLSEIRNQRNLNSSQTLLFMSKILYRVGPGRDLLNDKEKSLNRNGK